MDATVSIDDLVGRIGLSPLKQCFLSYSHRDYAACDRIIVHLKGYFRHLGFSIWYDHELRAGDCWSERLRTEIDRSDAHILIVTPDFMASHYIQEHEIPAVRKRYRKFGSLIVPIIVEECAWSRLCGDYVQAIPQAENRDLRPCHRWRPRERGYAAAARGADKALQEHFGIKPKTIIGPRADQ